MSVGTKRFFDLPRRITIIGAENRRTGRDGTGCAHFASGRGHAHEKPLTKNTYDVLVQEFPNTGIKASVGKTEPMPSALCLSDNVWNNKLTKDQKAARDKT